MSAQHLHLELTSHCVLKCPECPRTLHSSQLSPRHLSLRAIQRIALSRIDFSSIILCGNHGDPIYHPQFHEALVLLRNLKGNPKIVIATNGSHRDAPWWTKTASLLGPQDQVIFGVDGLEETSRLYRRGSNWKSVDLAIRTLKSKSKCKVIWQWILFRHNQDELEASASQARHWGVDAFYLVQSFRTGDSEQQSTISLEQAREDFLHGQNLSTLQM